MNPRPKRWPTTIFSVRDRVQNARRASLHAIRGGNVRDSQALTGFMVFQDSLARVVAEEVRARGDRYFEGGRVVTCTKVGELVEATVRGSDLYDVDVFLDEGSLEVRCDCFFFSDRRELCKHIWAVFCEMERQKMTPASRVDFIALLDEEGSVLDEIPLQKYVVPWRVATPLPEWKKLLAVIPKTEPAGPVTFPFTGEILYAVDLHGAARVQKNVRLVALSRTRKKSGEWSKPRELRVSLAQLDTLPDADRETLGLLNSHGYDYGHAIESNYVLRASAAAFFLPRLCATNRLFTRHQVEGLIGPLRWDDAAPWQVRVAVEHDADKSRYRIEGAFHRGTEQKPFSAAELVLPGLAIIDGTLARLGRSESLDWIDPLRKVGSIEVPDESREELVEALQQAPTTGLILPPELKWDDRALRPQPVLSLQGDSSSSEMSGRLSFRYGSKQVESGDRLRQWVDGRTVIRRQPELENGFVQQLAALPINRDYYGNFRIRSGSLLAVIEPLLATAWEIELDGSALRRADDVELSVQSGIDWFDLEGGARFGDETIPLPRLLAALSRNQSTITLADGSTGMIPRDRLEHFAIAGELGKDVDGALRFQSSQALLIDALLGAREKLSFGSSLDTLRSRIASASIQPIQEGASFQGELRPYQREGLGWMNFLKDAGLGGCLADDMGLGKTVQVLALLDSFRGSGAAPSLVVAPRSLLFNWKNEAARFAPELRLLEHHGTERIIGTDHFADYDLVLTTYGTLRRDATRLAPAKFQYVVLDEAQAIKNAGSQVSKAVRLLHAKHRLALSGTPIENHIGELWSLFEFLNPGMLGTSRFFSRTFASKSTPPERRDQLARAVRPFILRRTKEQVAPELPARVEQTLFCELEGSQLQEYEELREHYRRSLLGKVRAEGMARSTMHVLEALLRLRQAACHPGLIAGRELGESAKLDLLLNELDGVLESGHKALVFSQFTSFLSFVRERLDARGFKYCYLDGATRDRQAEVDRFQSDTGPPLFLISLKAGGVGLNLTNADYVFLLDPWWNPAVEAQAIDRSHRIGQEKPVFAYRLIARNTVEEKILELQERKRSMAESVITGENSILQKMEIEDLERLLS
ncbi:MAG TPA: DEAD/DEAH box helicase [Thermoanaerobaculia bacterium]|nr:DEAD/DEAH box helicase [Thermoanaerobaculia bacterium]